MNSLSNLVLATAAILLISATQLPVFGHGMPFDVGEVMVGDRRVSVTIDMKPVFLTQDDKVGSAIIRVKEVKTNMTLPHITYHLKITRVSELLLDERFHSHDGVVSLRFEHTDADKAEVIGNRESLYNAVLADLGNHAVVRGPVLVGGLYHYNITALSMERDENKLEEPWNINLYVSVGTKSEYDAIGTDSKQHKLSINSYYDQVSDIDYDTSTSTIFFTMPLNWNINYLEQIRFLHTEVRIPRDFGELMRSSYIGKMNGYELSSREVIVDDYSYGDNRIVHFVVAKAKLINIMLKQNPENDTAVFTLKPTEIPKFPLEILSGRQDLLVQITWNPPLIEPGKPIKFAVTIRDAKTLDAIKDSSADFVLLKDGKEIFRKHHRAPIGEIVQDYTFSEEQTGSILLLIGNINNTGDSAPLMLTVVPEFPMAVMALMTVMVATAVALGRFKKIFARLKYLSK